MEPELSAAQKERLVNIDARSPANWTLDDWVLKHYSLYGGNNRDKSPMELWLQVVTVGSRLAEDVRRGQIVKALNGNLVNLFGWLISFVGKYIHQPKFSDDDPIGEDLRRPSRTPNALPGPESFGKWVLQKYPGVCAACGNRPCICSAHRKTFEERKEKGYAKEVNRIITRGVKLRNKALQDYARNKRARDAFYERSLDQLIDEFIFIYGGGHQSVDLWQVAAHLLEEIGEVADEVALLSEVSSLKNLMSGAKPPVKFKAVVEKAFRKEGSPTKLKQEMERMQGGGENKIIQRLRAESLLTLKEELADVFSWLSAMLYKIGEIMREVEEDRDAWYSFKDRLEKRFFKSGAFVCFACGAAPCEDDCRAVWYVEKLFRDRKKALPHL